jgi:NAD(P)H-dependent FMN reductase
MITIVSGTHRAKSNSIKTAKAYAKLLTAMGVENQILDLLHLPKQFLWEDMFGRSSEEGRAMITKYIDAADRMIFIVPEYNGSYPGITKVLLDAIEPEKMRNKKVALTGIASGKFGNQRGLDDLTMVLHHLKVNVLPWKVIIPSVYASFDEDNGFKDEVLLKRIEEQLRSLLE